MMTKNLRRSKESFVINNAYAIQSSLFSLDSQFSCLDQVTEKLLPVVITHSGGELSERCDAVTKLRSNLLAGDNLSDVMSWLPSEVETALVSTVNQSGLIHYCFDNEEVVDALIIDLFESLEKLTSQVTVRLDALVQQKEQEALEEIVLAIAKRKKKIQKNKPIVLTNAQRLRIAQNAKQSIWQEIIDEEEFAGFLNPIWHERLAIWQQLEEVFSELGFVTGLGFDLSKGVFQSHGWLDMVRLNKVIKKLPKLQALIKDLGREKETEGTTLQEIVQKMSVTARVEKYLPTPLVPMETKGITRSDSISRMLPQEASLLTNPTLKRLWHAKRAEHDLLSYAVEGTELYTITEMIDEDVVTDKVGKQHNKQSGPMVICLDTSGSMRGTPENIAKATVLECMKIAYKENRACYAYLFGSKNEVKELELTLAAKGFDELLSFLSMSFGGGTDAEGPLNMALDKCDSDDWHKADILLVSDGEFSVSSGLSRKVNNRRDKRGLQLHGVLIGHESRAMEKICNPVHHFSQWIELQKCKFKG